MYDIAIIGAGPAGLSAAIAARARNKDVCVISNKPEQSQLAKAHRVDNYPGLPGVSGQELLAHFVTHAQSVGAMLRFARVISVLPMGEYFAITTSSNSISARSVILALGAAQASAAFSGEQEYLGRGVSYCATCDGMLYRDAVVAVVGLTPESVAEANFLAELGATVHFVVPRLSEQDRAALSSDITVHLAKPVAVQGDASGVSGLQIAARGVSASNAANNTSSSANTPALGESVIACRGVFVLRPSIAPTALLATLETRDGYLATAAGSPTQTSVPGIFAAGDCTGQPLQVAKAVGEGQLAAFAAVDYLSDLVGKE